MMKKLLAVLLILTLLLVCGAPAFAADEAEEPLAELDVEKNGHSLHLKLLKLAIEDGNLVVSINVDRLADWQGEDSPKVIILFEENDRSYKMDLISNSSVLSNSNVTNYKVTMKIPYDGSEMPKQILIDIGEGDPLVLWGESAAEEAEGQTGIADEYEWLSYTVKVDSVQVGIGKELEYPSTRVERVMETGTEIASKLNKTVVLIRFSGSSGSINKEDISEEAFSAFVLTDAEGEEIPLYSYLYWGVRLQLKNGSANLEVFDDQEGFILSYLLPEGVSSEDLTLSVK